MQAHAGLLSALENIKINLDALERLGSDAQYIAVKREWMKELDLEAEELLHGII